MGYQIAGNAVSYFSPISKSYHNCGTDPLPSYSALPQSEIAKNNNRNQVTIRFSQALNTLKDVQLVDCTILRPEKTELEEIPSIPDPNNEMRNTSLRITPESSSSKHKRIKERKVSEILSIVAEWRTLYQGFVDQQSGTFVKMTLEQAALKINMSKKSLDDYLLQIRAAMKYGFDFIQNSEEPVGTLRAFVKKNRNVKNSGRLDKKSHDKFKMPMEFVSLMMKKESKKKSKTDPDFQPTIGLSTRSKKI